MITEFSIEGSPKAKLAFIRESMETFGLNLKEHFAVAFADCLRHDRGFDQFIVGDTANPILTIGDRKATHLILPQDHQIALEAIGTFFDKILPATGALVSSIATLEVRSAWQCKACGHVAVSEPIATLRREWSGGPKVIIPVVFTETCKACGSATTIYFKIPDGRLFTSEQVSRWIETGQLDLIDGPELARRADLRKKQDEASKKGKISFESRQLESISRYWIDLPNCSVCGLAFAPNGKKLAVLTDSPSRLHDDIISIYDLVSKAWLPEKCGWSRTGLNFREPHYLLPTHFSCNGHMFASPHGHVAHIYDFLLGKQIDFQFKRKRLFGYGGYGSFSYATCQFLPNSSILMISGVAESKQQVQFWDFGAGNTKCHRILKFGNDEGLYLIAPINDNLVAYARKSFGNPEANRGNGLEIWDWRKGVKIKHINPKAYLADFRMEPSGLGLVIQWVSQNDWELYDCTLEFVRRLEKCPWTWRCTGRMPVEVAEAEGSQCSIEINRTAGGLNVVLTGSANDKIKRLAVSDDNALLACGTNLGRVYFFDL